VNLSSAPDKLITRLLSAATMRQRVIANNVANASTPGFLRGEVKFEAQLKAALERGETDIDHLLPSIETDQITPPGFDGNNVTLETEMNSLEENRITYELYASILASRTEMLRASIEER
jgi:flagellar basal-body rod protein FlgB